MTTTRLGRVVSKSNGDYRVLTCQDHDDQGIITEEVSVSAIYINGAVIGDYVKLVLQTGFAEAENEWQVDLVVDLTGPIKDALSQTIPPPITSLDMPGVPAHLKLGLRMYLERGVIPGSFLQAVLKNDLAEAIAHADNASLAGLKGLVSYLFNHVPTVAWKSREAVMDWASTSQAARDEVWSFRGGIR